MFYVGCREGVEYCDQSAIQYHLFESDRATLDKIKPEMDKRNLAIVNTRIVHMSEMDSFDKIKADIEGKIKINNTRLVSYLQPYSKEAKDQTLDEYATKHKIRSIDFIKLDAGGRELEVLRGARQTLNNTSIVQFEYGSTYADARVKLEQVYELLKESGFTHFYILGSNCLVTQSAPIEHEQYSNYIACKGSIYSWII